MAQPLRLLLVRLATPTNLLHLPVLGLLQMKALPAGLVSGDGLAAINAWAAAACLMPVIVPSLPLLTAHGDTDVSPLSWYPFPAFPCCTAEAGSRQPETAGPSN